VSTETIERSSIAIRRRILLAVLPCTTGGAVAVLILTNISLPLAAAGVGVIGVSAARFVWARVDADQRAWLRRRTGHGVVSGVAGVAAYDAVRYGINAAGAVSMWPFHAIALFGQQFIGADAPVWTQYAVGGAYHVVTGVGFIVAYALVFQRARWSTAIAWAAALEASVLLLYPSWLGLQSVNEFAVVSIGGHLAFGSAAATALRVLERRTS
jgi:hypothetical protein